MFRYLLDTNICIFLLRGRSEVITQIEKVGIDSCAISEITVAELFYGLECAKDSISQRKQVEEFCKSISVLPISTSLKIYARQKAELRSQGMLIDDLDLLIGSTAIAYDLTLVTDNTRHFERLPIQQTNWISRHK